MPESSRGGGGTQKDKSKKKDKSKAQDMNALLAELEALKAAKAAAEGAGVPENDSSENATEADKPVDENSKE